MTDTDDLNAGLNTNVDEPELVNDPDAPALPAPHEPLDPAKKKLLINLCMCMIASQTTR